MAKPFTVVMLMRAVNHGGFSIESVFHAVAAHLPQDIQVSMVSSPYPSRGVLNRLRAIIHARRASLGASVIHMTGDAHFLVYLLPRRRTVLTIHDCLFIERSQGIKRFLLWLFWIWLPAQRVRAITVVSEESKRQLLKWLTINFARIEVIENPLSKQLVFDDCAFAAAHTRLLMIGSAYHKNIERVAEAVSGLPVTLTIIGRMEEGRLERLRGEGLCVESRGNVSDAELAEAYAAADILVFPSLTEGFGLPILEAQAVGRPVVTSNRPPMSDVAGDGALLVDPEDVGSIRQAVARLIQDQALRAQLVAAGRANVARFSPKVTAQRYADLYRRVATEA